MNEITYCPICNIPFEKKPRKKYCCQECAFKGSYRNKKKQKKTKPNNTLSEKIREAKERGISYGQLIAEEYMKSM